MKAIMLPSGDQAGPASTAGSVVICVAVPPPDSGFSIDNLEPHVPLGFTLTYGSPHGNQLDWESSEDEDFQYFRVYRDTDPEFTPLPENLLHSTIDVAWHDSSGEPGHFYRISAVDFSGNESDAVVPEQVIAVGAASPPRSYALHQNAPNPFNPSTTIAFDAPSPGGHLRLHIYDVGGRLVRTLADGWWVEGSQSLRWDGRDQSGRPVASGHYIDRLEAPRHTDTRRMTLVR